MGRALRRAAWGVVAAGIAAPLVRKRVPTHPIVAQAAAFAAPFGLCVAARRSPARDLATCGLQMWAYVAAYKAPHDDPLAQERRVHIGYPIVADRVLGLRKGADDYLTKPFNLEELLLRIQKLIEKNRKMNDKDSSGELYSFGKNTIDFKAQEAVTKDGQRIQLSKKEAMLLKLLIENRNEVVTREKILQAVWGYNVYPTTRTIDNFVLNFRKYFEEDSRHPNYFHSVRGVGYKFTE